MSVYTLSVGRPPGTGSECPPCFIVLSWICMRHAEVGVELSSSKSLFSALSAALASTTQLQPTSTQGPRLPSPTVLAGHWDYCISRPYFSHWTSQRQKSTTAIFTRQVQPQNGSWNVINQTFHELKSLMFWGILNYTRMYLHLPQRSGPGTSHFVNDLNYVKFQSLSRITPNSEA
ncbi:uncharacterized protein HD556DRAFT_1310747 [Suillus plorans]|uniref:Uncharacterized protein n=1 Tax=Suillus plorans TaxID=116603 RepID=A0A9P7AIT5_9AGAM|nr:uncharacterized protein HD556DRAFT_1310747 [Suillus plorans]KAG1790359.1 hypothetical protein HD556DRAFT_1310747 [Suillus plorans]